MSKTIYCISGLGADERVFANLNIDGYRLKYIPWIRPEKNESIGGYAKRMAAPVEEAHPILLGVSFGGIMGIEMARQMRLKKLFIVSSVKTNREMPWWMKASGRLRLNRIVPVTPFTLTEGVANKRLGVSNEQEKLMVRDYRRKVDLVYFNWAIDQVVNWKNDWQPENIVHIHGDKDRIFPIKKLSPTHVVKGGTHMIIYNRAGEVGSLIERELI